MLVVRDLETFIRHIEGVGILHDELTTAQNSGTWTCLIAVLRLNLVERNRQILVGRILTLDHQGEHLLMSRAKQVVIFPTILQPEQVAAILGPPIGLLIRLPRQKRREVHLLETSRIHLFANDALDISVGDVAKWQPREDSRCNSSDVATTHEKSVARHLSISRILTQRAKEQIRQTHQHDGSLGPWRAGPRARQQDIGTFTDTSRALGRSRAHSSDGCLTAQRRNRAKT